MKRRLIAGAINYYPPEEGWVNVHMDKSDRPLWDDKNGRTVQPDVVWDIADLGASPPEDYDEIRCWQTIEHLDPKRTEQTLKGFFRILRPGGVLDIETPNLDAIAVEWVSTSSRFTKDQLLPAIFGTPNHEMFQDSDLMLHRTGFWPEKMEALLEAVGFDPGEKIDGDMQLHYRATKPDPKAITTKDLPKGEGRFQSGGKPEIAELKEGPDAEAERMAAVAKKKAKKRAARKGGKK